MEEETGYIKHQYIEMTSVKEESECQNGKCEERHPETDQIV